VKFGAGFWLDRSIAATVGFARAAERAGFDFVWFPDHYFLKDPFVVQALAAMKTREIRLGTAVTSPYLRHPTALASTIASLAEVANGRVVLGVGAGGHEFASDLMFDMSLSRTACAETISLIEGLLSGRGYSNAGRVFQVRNAQLRFAPTGRVPLYLAARGPRMLELAGERCNGMITHGVADRLLRFCVEHVRRGAQHAGRDSADVDVVLFAPMWLTDDVDAVKKALRPSCILMAGGEYADSLIDLYGLHHDEVAALRQAVRAGDFRRAGTLVTPQMVDAFCIVGTAEECRRQLERVARLGVTHFIISLPGAPGEQPLTDLEVRAAVLRLGRELVGPLGGE
jgi:5,10-methylenetetrahydromethanopterin reductase